jgi:hypothetical protein
MPLPRRRTTAAAALILVTLTACGSSSSPTSVATPLPTATGDTAFLYNVQTRHMAGTSAFPKFPAETLKKLGHLVCTKLNSEDAAKVDAELLSTDTLKNEPPANIGSFVTTAVVAYCPAHEKDLQ